MSEYRNLKIQLEAYDQGGGIDEIRVFQNGKLIFKTDAAFKSAPQEGNTKQVTVDVTLAEGMNKIMVTALSNKRSESLPDMIEVAYKSFVVPQSDLYILAVGINQYENERYNLNYAQTDAATLTDAIAKGGANIFRNIYRKEIYNREATAKTIVEGFEEFIKNAREEDVFVFYYAGHGSVYQDETGREEYFLCPTDVTKLYGSEQILRDKGISAERMRDLCQSVRAQKQLILLDACHSGAATKAFSTRGAGEERAIVQLARSAGVTMIAASEAQQYATEVEALGHGIFTYSLLKALRGEADGANGDKKITVSEIRAFVEDVIPQLSQQHKGSPQFPTVWSSGQDFPLVIAPN